VTPPVCAGFEFDEMISESLREVNAIGLSVACRGIHRLPDLK